jgi:hypothetical protein
MMQVILRVNREQIAEDTLSADGCRVMAEIWRRSAGAHGCREVAAEVAALWAAAAIRKEAASS